ncbi:MAG: hypothetical protein FJ091_01050 [Deltaproteobacteria bacterium]|nr:hypothetical protein [Deltaproteobacteria bacterium]
MRLVIAVTLMLCSVAAAETTQTGATALRRGVNALDLDGDGEGDAVIVAMHELGNAHSALVTSFVRVGANARWEIVPLRWKRGGEELSLRAVNGADCQLRDLRLVPSAKGFSLVVAERELGESYADARPVTFRWLELAPDEPSASLVWREVRSSATTASYCDVGEAFARELGLPAR